MKAAFSTPAAWFEGNTIHVLCAGREWTLARGGNLEELWAAIDENDFVDERIPYWIELWPSSLALGEWLFRCRESIKGNLCLDMGCGLGLTALIGRWLGANMVAMDYEPEALKCCLANAESNNISGLTWLAMDWRAPAFARNIFTHIWAADIIYERRFIKPALKFMEYALAPNGVVWIAEPGRAIFNEFLKTSAENGWFVEEIFAMSAGSLYPDQPKNDVRIHQARKKSDNKAIGAGQRKEMSYG